MLHLELLVQQQLPARLVQPGHKCIVASFGSFDEDDLVRYSPIVVHVNDRNDVMAVDSDPSVLLAANPEQESFPMDTSYGVAEGLL